VELDAVEGPGFVTDSHDFVFGGPGGHLEIGGECAGADDEGVIAGGFEGVGEACEDAIAVMEDGGGFAVHQAPVALDGSAPGVANALVAEAYAEGGEFGAEVLEDFVGDAGLFGAAGAGGDNDVGGFEGFDLVDGGFVVAEDAHGAFGVQFADALDEVVGEGVVVIDQYNHGRSICKGRAEGKVAVGVTMPSNDAKGGRSGWHSWYLGKISAAVWARLCRAPRTVVQGARGGYMST
jgi:hypothetical protein